MQISVIFVCRLVFIVIFVLIFATCISSSNSVVLGVVLLLIFLFLTGTILLTFSFVLVSGNMVVTVLVQIFVLMH